VLNNVSQPQDSQFLLNAPAVEASLLKSHSKLLEEMKELAKESQLIKSGD
jgi:hypothetical protein